MSAFGVGDVGFGIATSAGSSFTISTERAGCSGTEQDTFGLNYHASTPIPRIPALLRPEEESRDIMSVSPLGPRSRMPRFLSFPVASLLASGRGMLSGMSGGRWDCLNLIASRFQRITLQALSAGSVRSLV